MLTDEFGNGVDGASDELAFEDDDVCGIALQSGVEIGESFDLGDDTNIVFEGKDLLHADAIDGLRVGKNDANADGCRVFFWSVFPVAAVWVDVNYCHMVKPSKNTRRSPQRLFSGHLADSGVRPGRCSVWSRPFLSP